MNDGLAAGELLVVYDDLEVELVVGQDTLDGFEVDPQRVTVEDLELLDRLEVLYVLLWHLSNLQQTNLALVVDESSTLDIGLGFVRYLGDELGLRVDHVLEDVEVDSRAQVVDVGDEDVFFAGSDEAVEEATVVDGVVQITVSRGVPVGLVARGAARGREVRLLADSRVSRLVEGEDLDVVVGVLLDDASRVVVGVEASRAQRSEMQGGRRSG